MKLFNQEKLQRLKLVARWLWILRVIRLPLLPIAFVARLRKRPDFLVADGFLIGDCVLLRPMLGAMCRKGRVRYIGGAHAKEILGDLGVEHEVFQWPWANYDYSVGSAFRLLSLWFRILVLQPRVIVEPRGDLRSLAVLYLTCPQRLAGYSFTGGAFMLDVDPALPEVVHLEEHNRVLATSLGLEYRLDDLFQTAGNGDGSVAISFSGSQPLKVMPTNVAKFIVQRLQKSGRRVSYLRGPGDFFLSVPENLALLEEAKIPIKQESFKDYVSILRRVSGYIGMDSGGGHLASMFQKPSVIFLSTQFSAYCGPRGKQAIFVESAESLACRPCAGVTCINDQYLRCLSIPEGRLLDALDEFNQRLGAA
ncbi:MAG: hypothetical protein JNM27_22345 [Leptospirales bacterium]|nr:hypothetical protein [Leptospirales bacterium]